MSSATKTVRFEFKSSIPSIVLGEAYVITPSSAPYPKYWISDKEITSEILRLKRAIQHSKEQLNRIKDRMCKFRGDEQFKILESHVMLLQDETLMTHTVKTLTSQKINAEWSLEKTLQEFKLVFSDMGEEYFEQRKDDIDYVGKRILLNLQGSAEFNLDNLIKGKYILIADDLSPADVAAIPRDRVEGFITASGGFTSHTAIIARSLEIPAVLGSQEIVNSITMGDTVVIDGVRGEVIVNPSNSAVKHYRDERLQYQKLEERLVKTSHIQAKTKDGKKINIVANIELIEEIPSALEHGAEGIGLYRTEFMYANRIDYPTEDELVDNYSEVMRLMAPRPVTIRTLDIGGDKLFYSGEFGFHANPALGLRAIRFSLAEREMFKTQLRALLRANNHGNLRVMIPMVSDITELLQVKEIIKGIVKDFKTSGIPYNDNFELGIMVEVPSAVITADMLAEEADFFSIGTNDLIQYTLAIDRINEKVSYLFRPLHPAILRMISSTVAAAKARKRNVTLCGEMAGDPLNIMVLIGLGLDALSMNPISIPRVKQIIRSIDYKEATRFVRGLMDLKSADEVERCVEKTVSPIIAGALKQYSKRLKEAK